LLIIQRAGIGVSGYAQVRAGSASIFVTDVALADIARQDDHFLSGMKRAGLAVTHMTAPAS
jgi:hypothetical protein